MVCSKCGYKSNDSVPVCLNCGNTLDISDAVNFPNNLNGMNPTNELLTNSKKSYHTLILLIVFGFAVLILIAITSKHNVKMSTEDVYYGDTSEEVFSIFDKWQSEDKGIFVFEDNNTFHWFLNNNHYVGISEIEQGFDALRKLNMSYKDISNLMVIDDYVSLSQIYYIKVKPTNYTYDQLDNFHNISCDLLLVLYGDTGEIWNLNNNEFYYIERHK